MITSNAQTEKGTEVLIQATEYFFTQISAPEIIFSLVWFVSTGIDAKLISSRQTIHVKEDSYDGILRLSIQGYIGEWASYIRLTCFKVSHHQRLERRRRKPRQRRSDWGFIKLRLVPLCVMFCPAESQVHETVGSKNGHALKLARIWPQCCKTLQTIRNSRPRAWLITQLKAWGNLMPPTSLIIVLSVLRGLCCYLQARRLTANVTRDNKSWEKSCPRNFSANKQGDTGTSWTYSKFWKILD